MTDPAAFLQRVWGPAPARTPHPLVHHGGEHGAARGGGGTMSHFQMDDGSTSYGLWSHDDWAEAFLARFGGGDER